MELDHFFILTDRPAENAAAISETGLAEGSSNDHPGQSTSNRRFFFSNTALELLYVRDAVEAETGPGRRLGFPERVNDPDASPFGLITRTDSCDKDPYAGWPYQPDYFEPGYRFLVGENSDSLAEPMCIHMPFNLPRPAVQSEFDAPFDTVTELRIHVPVTEPSDVLQCVSKIGRISVAVNFPHLMELVFNDESEGKLCDLRPALPLQIRW